MTISTVHNSSYVSRRLVAFVAILAVHALVIWAFISGFANQGARYVETILQTNMIQTEKPKELPPPPPPVDLKERPPVQVIAPEINIAVPVEAPPPPITNITTTPQAPPPPRAIVPGTPVKVTFSPDPSDYYPDVSRRNGEEGRAIVKVCVNVSGKIDSVEIATTTEHPLLDEAAIKVAKAMKFKPATSEGKPVLSCPTLPVKFVLKAGG
jgi:protein TonB